MNIESWLEKNTIFHAIIGSHAYGLNDEFSDIDYRGVAIAPNDYYLGMYNFEQHETKEPDSTIFDIKKFFKLASDCNPNICEFFFLPEECILTSEPEWKAILEYRDIFLSKKAKFTYSGYAYSQLKRIKTHRKWLLEPMTHKPERSEFGLDNVKKISKEHMGYYDALVNKSFIPQELIDVYEKEKQYKNAMNNWDQFCTWKEHRNPKRALLEAKFGYDLKHATHLMRLLLQAKDILQHQTLNVRLEKSDLELCKAIKAGAFSFDALLELSDNMNQELNVLYETSTLRNRVNTKEINDILVQTIEMFYRRN